MVTAPAVPEIYEEELQSAIDARGDSLQALRELGPPDLVHLIKQPIKSANKQVRAISFSPEICGVAMLG